MASYKNADEAQRYQTQLTKLRDFRKQMSEKYFASKASQEQKPEVTIQPLHNDSAPLMGLAHAAILKNRGYL